VTSIATPDERGKDLLTAAARRAIRHRDSNALDAFLFELVKDAALEPPSGQRKIHLAEIEKRLDAVSDTVEKIRKWLFSNDACGKPLFLKRTLIYTSLGQVIIDDWRSWGEKNEALLENANDRQAALLSNLSHQSDPYAIVIEEVSFEVNSRELTESLRLWNAQYQELMRQHGDKPTVCRLLAERREEDLSTQYRRCARVKIWMEKDRPDKA